MADSEDDGGVMDQVASLNQMAGILEDLQRNGGSINDQLDRAQEYTAEMLSCVEPDEEGLAEPMSGLLGEERIEKAALQLLKTLVELAVKVESAPLIKQTRQILKAMKTHQDRFVSGADRALAVELRAKLPKPAKKRKAQGEVDKAAPAVPKVAIHKATPQPALTSPKKRRKLELADSEEEDDLPALKKKPVAKKKANQAGSPMTAKPSKGARAASETSASKSASPSRPTSTIQGPSSLKAPSRNTSTTSPIASKGVLRVKRGTGVPTDAVWTAKTKAEQTRLTTESNWALCHFAVARGRCPMFKLVELGKGYRLIFPADDQAEPLETRLEVQGDLTTALGFIADDLVEQIRARDASTLQLFMERDPRKKLSDAAHDLSAQISFHNGCRNMILALKYAARGDGGPGFGTWQPETEATGLGIWPRLDKCIKAINKHIFIYSKDLQLAVDTLNQLKTLQQKCDDRNERVADKIKASLKDAIEKREKVLKKGKDRPPASLVGTVEPHFFDEPVQPPVPKPVLKVVTSILPPPPPMASEPTETAVEAATADDAMDIDSGDSPLPEQWGGSSSPSSSEVAGSLVPTHRTPNGTNANKSEEPPVAPHWPLRAFKETAERMLLVRLLDRLPVVSGQTLQRLPGQPLPIEPQWREQLKPAEGPARAVLKLIFESATSHQAAWPLDLCYLFAGSAIATRRRIFLPQDGDFPGRPLPMPNRFELDITEEALGCDLGIDSLQLTLKQGQPPHAFPPGVTISVDLVSLA